MTPHRRAKLHAKAAIRCKRRSLRHLCHHLSHPSAPKFSLERIPDHLITSFVESFDPTSLHQPITANNIHPFVVKDADLSSILTRLGAVERHLFGSSISANKIEPRGHGTDYNRLPLVMDTGASSFLTPFKADFVDYVPCDIPMNTVGDEKRVVGVGTVMYKFCTTAGDTVFLPGFGYHMPQAGVRLASPQSFYKQFGGYGRLNGHEYVHVLANKSRIVIPIDSVSNLPLAYDVACSSAQKKLHGSTLNASLAEH